jgi:hypothetical protein
MSAPKKITNKHFKESPFIETCEKAWNYLMLNLPPGPAIIPQKYYVNL